MLATYQRETEKAIAHLATLCTQPIAVRRLAGKTFFVATTAEAAEEKAARLAEVDSVLRIPFSLDQVNAEIDRVMGDG